MYLVNVLNIEMKGKEKVAQMIRKSELGSSDLLDHHSQSTSALWKSTSRPCTFIIPSYNKQIILTFSVLFQVLFK